MWLWFLKMILRKADHSVDSGEGLESFGPGRGFACLKFSVTTTWGACEFLKKILSPLETIVPLTLFCS